MRESPADCGRVGNYGHFMSCACNDSSLLRFMRCINEYLKGNNSMYGISAKLRLRADFFTFSTSISLRCIMLRHLYQNVTSFRFIMLPLQCRPCTSQGHCPVTSFGCTLSGETLSGKTFVGRNIRH